MSWGPRAYSAQFHIEVEADTVDNWAAIPAYADALKMALGDDGAARLRKDCADQMQQFEKMAERIYINWLQTSART
jgi:GMP synthase-like glutamine amidotransferase